MDDYVWAEPAPASHTMEQLARKHHRRRVWREWRGCLWVPALWLAGIVIPAALTIVFGSLWIVVAYVAVMGIIGTAYMQGKR